MNNLDWALEYAKLGWRIFPCAPGAKTPITRHGVKDASREEIQIREWWKETPNANIAVALGEPSGGIYVVDVDVSDKANGWESLKELGKSLPETIRQNTPSGGAHFFYRADNPPANKNNFLPGIDIRGDGYYVIIAPSIHPNGGEYQWVDGQSPWDLEPAEFPDCLRPEIKPAPARQIILSPLMPVDNSVLSRASAYLATCDPAVQGQGGHSSLLWAAYCMVHGFLLSDDQALNLLIHEYNPRCDPPWDLGDTKDYKDFTRKVSEARKLNGKHPRGWLLEENVITDMNVEEFFARLKDRIKGLYQKEVELIRRHENPVTPEELQFLTHPTGLVGDICSWVNSTSMMRQPLLTLGCVLTFCGALFGRKVRDRLGNRTNLYCMAIATSSDGKNHAMECIRRLCLYAGCMNLLGGDDWASDASIESRLEKDPSTLFLCDEIAHSLLAIKNTPSSHTAKIISTLMKLYSAAKSSYTGREYKDIDMRRTLIQPCCCLYGLATPRKFLDALSIDQLEDGWLPRCLILYGDRRPEKNYDAYSEDVPEELIQAVKAWSARMIVPSGDSGVEKFIITHGLDASRKPPAQLLVPTDPEAQQIYEDFNQYATDIQDRDQIAGCLWSKAEENARRIGLIIASGENFDQPVITPAVADYAVRLVKYLVSNFSSKIGEIGMSEITKQREEVYRYIEKQGTKGCTKTSIARAPGLTNTLKPRREMLLDDLKDAERIVEMRTKSEGGRPKTLYWTVENFVRWKEKLNQL